jgi:hypothetical protein
MCGVLEHCWPFHPVRQELSVSLLLFLYGSLLLIDGKFAVETRQKFVWHSISLTMNTDHLHKSRHNFLKHMHAYYSSAD